MNLMWTCSGQQIGHAHRSPFLFREGVICPLGCSTSAGLRTQQLKQFTFKNKGTHIARSYDLQASAPRLRPPFVRSPTPNSAVRNTASQHSIPFVLIVSDWSRGDRRRERERNSGGRRFLQSRICHAQDASKRSARLTSPPQSL